MITYEVSWWDHETSEWHVHCPKVGKWGLRRVLRRLYAKGWSHISLMVDRNGGDDEAGANG